MKALKCMLAAMALSILIPLSASADLGDMRTTLVERGVYVYTEEEGRWSDVEANFPLREGDSLWAALNGRAEISIRGGTYVRMDSETMLDILQVGRYSDSGEDTVRLFMEEGSVYVNNERSRYDYVQIESEYSAVRIPIGAVAMVEVYSDGASRVSVLKGHVISQSSGGGARLDAGSSALLGEEPYARIMPLGEATAWERWNRDRDKELQGVYASTRYLPTELHDYAYDFDSYGSWVYVRDYGHVWRPSLSVSISVGWAPYRHGHWRWRHGHYVWVSYERWGWAPYHYGRWTYLSGIGWCWVPPSRGAAYWGPGYVAWVYTSGYVGWVPLAPRETYYGYGYYGPNSVNIIDIDIHKTKITNVYVNSSVKDAVTVVERDSFLSGRDKPAKPPKGFFGKDTKGAGPPPDFRPDREGKPVARDMDVYKPARERAAERPEATRKERAAERPAPPGRAEQEKKRERVIVPTREGAPSRERERATTPSRETAPGRIETPSRETAPGRMETPSRESAPSRERERGTTPSRETAPGRVETPSRENVPSRGNERATTPSRETAPGRMETPSRESAPSRGNERATTPSRETAPGRVEAPSRETSPSRAPARVIVPSQEPAPSEQSPEEGPTVDTGRSKDKERGKK